MAPTPSGFQLDIGPRTRRPGLAMLRSGRGAVRALAYGSSMEGNTPIDALLEERQHLTARIEREREQLHRLRIVVSNLEQSVARAEGALSEVDALLGRHQRLRAA